MDAQSLAFVRVSNLTATFYKQLNRIYATVDHLSRHLGDLRANATFYNLKFALEEESENSIGQVTRVDQMFLLMGMLPSRSNHENIDFILDEAFLTLYKCDNCYQVDSSLVFYMAMIDHIQIDAFKLLKQISPLLGRVQIQQLIDASFDSVSDSVELFTYVSEECILAEAAI